MPTFNYTVDDEQQSTTSQKLTPREIMTAAEIDPETHYLVLIQGNHQKSLENKTDEPINMHQKMRFISISTEPTPVA